MKSVDQKAAQKNVDKKKGFWAGLVARLDGIMVAKACQSSCCGKGTKGGKCC